MMRVKFFLLVILVMLLALLAQGVLAATPSVTITDPEDGQVFHLGDTVTVSCKGKNNHHIALAITDPSGETKWHQFDGNKGTATISADTEGTYELLLRGRNTPSENDPGTQDCEIRISIMVTSAPAQTMPVPTVYFANIGEEEILTLDAQLVVEARGENNHHMALCVISPDQIETWYEIQGNAGDIPLTFEQIGIYTLRLRGRNTQSASDPESLDCEIISIIDIAYVDTSLGLEPAPEASASQPSTDDYQPDIHDGYDMDDDFLEDLLPTLDNPTWGTPEHHAPSTEDKAPDSITNPAGAVVPQPKVKFIRPARDESVSVGEEISLLWNSVDCHHTALKITDPDGTEHWFEHTDPVVEQVVRLEQQGTYSLELHGRSTPSENDPGSTTATVQYLNLVAEPTESPSTAADLETDPTLSTDADQPQQPTQPLPEADNQPEPEGIPDPQTQPSQPQESAAQLVQAPSVLQAKISSPSGEGHAGDSFDIQVFTDKNAQYVRLVVLDAGAEEVAYDGDVWRVEDVTVDRPLGKPHIQWTFSRVLDTPGKPDTYMRKLGFQASVDGVTWGKTCKAQVKVLPVAAQAGSQVVSASSPTLTLDSNACYNGATYLADGDQIDAYVNVSNTRRLHITIVGTSFSSTKTIAASEIEKREHLPLSIPSNALVAGQYTVRITASSSEIANDPGRKYKEAEYTIRVNAPHTSAITAKLDDLISGAADLHYKGSTQKATAGTTWGDWKSSVWGSRCKGFASAVFYELYGFEIAASYKNAARHTLALSNADKTLIVFSVMRPADIDTLANLLQQAQPGDYIQMSKWDKRESKDTQHSMIVYTVETGGIWVYDANSDNENTIKKGFRSWADFFNYMGSTSYGISLYRAK